MANIFFAWEVGSNLGHLMSVLPVATELFRQGHQVTLSVKDLARFAQINNQLPIAVVQSPIFFPPASTVGENFGYCDILATGGFRSESTLLPLVLAWRQLFELTAADIVVCQHAPSALLTARICNLPALVIGSGFMCPPAQVPLPAFERLSFEQRERLTCTEAEVLDTCNTVLERFFSKPLNHLADLFHEVNTILCIYPELDHYEGREVGQYFGPLYSDTNTMAAAFPKIFKKNILIYINNFKCWKNILEASVNLGANILCVAVGLPESESQRIRLPHIEVLNRPVPLESAYQKADLVICHGGPGVVAGALTAKKPVLILPTQKEQLMLARRIEKQGYGEYISLDASGFQIRAAMDRLLSDVFDKSAITNFSVKYAQEARGDRVRKIVEKILLHLDD